MKTKGILFFVCCVLFIFCIEKTNANLWSLPNIPENVTDAEVLEKWIKIDKNLKGVVRSVIKSLMPKLLQSSDKLKLSPECVKESLHLISGLRSLKKSAFSFLDASAKLPDGIFTNSVSFLGMYDECLSISVPHAKNKTEVLYRGKYCTIEGYAPLPPKKRKYTMKDQVEALANFTGTDVVKFLSTQAHFNYFLRYHIGVCVPSGCTTDDLNQILQLATEYSLLNLEVTHCEIAGENVELSGTQIFTILLCITLGILVLTATWFEIRKKEKNNYDSICLRILLCFSLKSNFKRLTSTRTSIKSLTCLNGVKSLTITWAAMAHCYLYSGWFSRSYSSLNSFETIFTAPVVQMIINGSEAVDSFFFMTGMLVCYGTLKFVKIDKKRFDIISFLIHRFWRIIPVYYFILLFGSLAPLMGSGPLFHETMTESFDACSKYWWRNALFINNFFDLKDACMMHTWYISCDIQLYLLSLLVLIPMLKSEKIGVAVNFLLIAISIVYTGIIIHVKDVPPTLLLTHPDPMDRNLGLWYSYGHPISRLGPYLIGVFVGYLVIKYPDIKIPKKCLILGWCLAVVSSGTTIFITAVWFRVRVPTRLEELMYGAFYKVAYTAGIAWMVFCCVTGQGGFINDFLSWKGWFPLSKLALLVYLIGPFYQTLYIANFKLIQEISNLHFITQFFGFLCISSLLAMIVNLLVESPSLQLEKIIFQKKATKKKENGVEDEIENGLKSDIPIKTMNGKKNSTVENGINNMSFDSKI